jgi:hypothetical protein
VLSLPPHVISFVSRTKSSKLNIFHYLKAC